MNILIIGQGGREHAIAWQIAKFSETKHVFVAPGNAGTALEDKITNVAIDVLAIDELIQFAKEHAIELTIVGPEAPLAAGIVDVFNDHGLKCFGPSKACAELESSKVFAKAFMSEHDIPTAAFASFTDISAAKDYVKKLSTPIVIKADGLAAGKGVIIAQTELEAFNAIDAMLSAKQFADACNKIVIEEFLQGIEASFICILDGEHILPLASSQDHKTRDDGDKGPNTGGMGAYSPAPMLTPELEAKALKQVIEPILKGMQERGTAFTGFLYAGLMIMPDEEIKVLEFNCRLGDPETQPILMRLKTNLAELCLAALDKALNTSTADWDPRAALAVVLAAGGYPNSYAKGDEIFGLGNVDNGKIFHAGTKLVAHKIVTNGGRVLAACALGDTIQQAKDEAYQLAEKISFKNVFYRKDIGVKGIG